MSRNLSGIERALAVGMVALCGFVGALVFATNRSDAPRVNAISGADSIQIAAQYYSQLAIRPPEHRTPKWLAQVHIARLQQAAVVEKNTGEPAPIPPDSVKAVLDAASGSYFERMLADDNGGLSRWRVGENPVRVWVQPYSSEPGFSPDLVSPARRGFTAWNDVGLDVQFELVEDSTIADVHVTWSHVMARQEQVGVTFRMTTGGGWIALAHVILSTARDIYTVQNAVRHEAGHVLGLGHSPNADDIMAGMTEGRQYKITDADARTAALLYRLPAGVVQR